MGNTSSGSTCGSDFRGTSRWTVLLGVGEHLNGLLLVGGEHLDERYCAGRGTSEWAVLLVGRTTGGTSWLAGRAVLLGAGRTVLLVGDGRETMSNIKV